MQVVLTLSQKLSGVFLDSVLLQPDLGRLMYTSTVGRSTLAWSCSAFSSVGWDMP